MIDCLASLEVITCHRYREIYFDFKRDFAETAGSIHRKREQVELFRGATASKNKADGEAHLYAEQEALSSSLRSAGSVIGQADEVIPPMSLPVSYTYTPLSIFTHD